MYLRSALLIVLCGLTASAAALAAPVITLLYEERAPYQMRSGADVVGTVAGPAALAFKAAAIAFEWQPGSVSRQLHMLRENSAALCTVGLYKNSERQAYAKYTKPIYRNGPAVALVRRQFDLGAARTLEQSLSVPGLRLLVRREYSYGIAIDKALAHIKPDTIVSPLTNSQLAEKLMADRADMMFASEEEAQSLLQFLGQKSHQLRVWRFSDAPLGLERHIVCSRSVPDDVIDRLNGAITFK